MAATEPIRDKKQLKALSEYFLKQGQPRNYTMVVLGACTVLRISGLLRLKWEDVYDEKQQNFRTHVTIREKKTGKDKIIALNKQALGALALLRPHRRGEFIFAIVNVVNFCTWSLRQCSVLQGLGNSNANFIVVYYTMSHSSPATSHN